jgi:hypothetical protein
MVAMKGSRAASEIADAAETLARLGCGTPELLVLGAGPPARLVPPTTVVRVVRSDEDVRG